MTIGNSVTYIGTSVFKNISELKKLELNCPKIKPGWFQDLSSIKEIVIGNNVTEIEDNALSSCSIRNLYIEDGTETLSLGCVFNYNGRYYGLFDKCKLDSLYLGRNISYVNMRYYFITKSLSSLTYGKNVTSSNGVSFSDCSVLTNIHFMSKTPPFVGEYNFTQGQYANISLYVPIGSLNSYQSAEPWCNFWNIKEMDLSSKETNYAIIANYNSSQGCVTINGVSDTSIKVKENEKVVFEIKPASGYEIDKVTCNGVDISNNIVDGKYTIEKVTENIALEVTFKKQETPNTEKFEVDGIYHKVISNESKTVEVSFKGNTFMEYENEYVGEIIIPETVNFENTTYSVTSIGNMAFADCGNLTSVTIPNSITNIGNFAFDGCNLTSIIIPKSITSIGTSIFRSCMTLNSIVVDEENTNYDSRDNCNSIIETETNTLISGCKNSVIPNSVTCIGNQAFYGCKGLTYISIPNTVINIGNSAFDGCNGLTSITIPNSVKTIGDYAFMNCNLTAVSIGNKVVNIGKFAFNYCNLTTIIIPNSVTKIDNSAFANNSRLATVNIGENVDTIGDKAFYNCYISSIYCKAIIPPVATNEKDKATFIENVMLSAILYVPIGCKAVYSSAEPWSKFKIQEYEFSDVESTLADNVNVSIENGNIVIGGADNSNVEVYNVNGQCVYNGNATTISVSAKGMYIVKVGNKSFKVIL